MLAVIVVNVASVVMLVTLLAGIVAGAVSARVCIGAALAGEGIAPVMPWRWSPA